ERLADLVAGFERDSSIPCRVSVEGGERELGSEARLTVYRVAQEALTNVRRHAGAERVELGLRYEPESVRLVVEDFASATAAPADADRNGGGYGLTGMRERAELLGGTLVAAATATGFRVELRVPA